MKKIISFVAAFVAGIIGCSSAFAQAGYVNTVAGCYFCVATPVDGVLATIAQFSSSAGIGLDASRNVYITDQGFNKVRRVMASSNLVYTVAGTGTVGFSGDGGPATAATLNAPDGIFIDAANNLFIADEGNNRIRKVDALTGNINTIAGGGASTADGVPATTASINPVCVYVDAAGNIYTGGGNKLRKINGTSGLITTVAGNGTYGDAGDGGPAISAGIAGPVRFITMDAAGNIYMVTNAGDRVRKIDALTGIITTVAGGGSCTADGILATLCRITDMHSCGVDPAGNIIIADGGDTTGFFGGDLREVDAVTQKIYTIAGGGASTLDGVPALTAYVNDEMIYMDNAGGKIYYTDSAHWIRELNYSPLSYSGLVKDSFTTNINHLCSGPMITVNTNTYTTGMSITTWFGDGQVNITPITLGCSTSGGTAVITHTYANSGTYTIKQVLYEGSAPVDSMHESYQHSLCNSLYTQLYFDKNNNCIKDSNDPYIQYPILVEIDSNGTAVDTISTTSGFYYTGYGSVGDIYTFRPVSTPLGLYITCPGSGIVSDTLQSLLYNIDTMSMGFNCSDTSAFDLSVNFPRIYTGTHMQLGNIYVKGVSCSDKYATVTLTYSPKYDGDIITVPTASSTSGNTITWDLNGLKYDTSIIGLFYVVHVAHTYMTIGDTVHSEAAITPITGDVNPVNNIVDILDTIKGDFDPNEMSVSPESCVPVGTDQLQYTINFENTGNDTAFNIYVMDTLPSYVNPQSMRIVMASAQMDVSVISSGGYNILKFDFPNINLLDSSHHGQCDGAVIFNIGLNTSVPWGTQVYNHAGIYFDDNPVVMTNSVEDIIGCELSVSTISNAHNVAVFPNPATEELTIKMDNGAYNNYEISNSIGQIMLQHEINNTQTTLSVKSLPAGLYYISLKGDSGTKVMKFVKM